LQDASWAFVPTLRWRPQRRMLSREEMVSAKRGFEGHQGHHRRRWFQGLGNLVLTPMRGDHRRI